MKVLRLMMIVIGILTINSQYGFSAPGDVVMSRSGKAEKTYPPATFPHWTHSIRYRCYACHPTTFKMVKFKTTKGSLKEDRQPIPGDPAATSEPPSEDEEIGQTKKPVTEKPDKEKPKEKKSDNKEKAAKDSENKKTASAREQEMHGRTACGMCHNGTISFNVEFRACARCHVPKK